MKTEPTAATMASIYGIMDLELSDLNIEPGADAFSSIKAAAGYADTAAGGLLDKLDDLIHALKAAEAETDPAKLHGHFTEMYRAAIDAAGRSVRLAAIARLGIIQSDTMRIYDRVEPESVKHG